MAEESIPDIAESVQIEQKIPDQKFTNYRKRLTSEEEYHQRVEQRIDDLITRLENKEIKLSDLSKEDQQVIMDILNQNG
jgi:predicted  nucleic acid-binding Zn-ribbon protein